MYMGVIDLKAQRKEKGKKTNTTLKMSSLITISHKKKEII